MNCIHHPENPAVAVCMGCGAALCHECSARVVSGKHSCSDSCSTAISDEKQVMSELISKTRFGYRLMPLLFVPVGFLFICLGLSSLWISRFTRADLMAVFIGILFVFMGLYSKTHLPKAA